MRSGFLMLSVLAFAAVVGYAQTTTTPAQTPATQSKLEIIGGDTYDWGKTKPPTEGHLEATIKMKNAGTAGMKLVEIKPGCGCTKTDPDKMEVQPGDVSTMGVKLNVSPSQNGPITKSITIRWMDLAAYEAREAARKSGQAVPANLDTTEKVAYLFLKADIQRAIALSPSIYFSFQNLEIGQKSNATVTISNNSDQEVTFSDFKADNGLVLSKSGKVTLKPGESFDLTATLVPSMKGQYSGLAQCKTSHPEHPTVEIRAYGFVKENESPVYQQPK